MRFYVKAFVPDTSSIFIDVGRSDWTIHEQEAMRFPGNLKQSCFSYAVKKQVKTQGTADFRSSTALFPFFRSEFQIGNAIGRGTSVS